MAAAQVSVVRAFRHSGGLNAGTPSDTASTPVRATAPCENARRRRKRVSACTPVSAETHSGGGVYGARLPVADWTRPHATTPRMTTMYRYVGAMKIVPDSRMPRRLPTVSSAMAATPIGTRYSHRAGTIEVIAATPAEIETATVTT